MSAKKAKQLRADLRNEIFPSVQETVHVEAVTQYDPRFPFDLTKAKILPEKTYQVEVNHKRRIRSIVRSTRLSVADAIGLYKKRLEKKAVKKKRISA
ncbi:MULTISPECIES: hypothetical protein [unclassified Spirosoma]|uniref:hypothetical protein n=1 Tax=unclassified Spirosoma TaxID=2621999 RepID=UPI00096564DB|nr:MULTISPECIES: hypothetical protein [unclassified Spirosoma]MBN8821315.1 hypothetical protein [Spirosoma sp.]OJW78103.1 MAG: hypothetical protein BGO59_29225 [Spirosoma sp. 48-14]